jgi:ABC-type bacteriocin/lantibiotic exporter with double-glycine peptidase domain
MSPLVRELPWLVPDLRRRAAVAGALALLQVGLQLPIALLLRRLFEHSIPSRDDSAIVLSGVLIVACAIGSATVAVASRAYGARVTNLAAGRVRRELLEHLCALPLRWHDHEDAGTVHAVAIQDCERVDRMVYALFGQLLASLAVTAALAIVALVFEPILFAVLVAVVPLMLVLRWTFSRSFRRVLAVWHASAAALSSNTQLLLRGIATLRAAGAERDALDRLNGQIDDYTRAGYRSAVGGARHASVQGAASTVAGVAVLVVGGLLISGHHLTLGSLVAFYAVVALMLAQLSTGLATTAAVLEGEVALGRIRKILAIDDQAGYRGTRTFDFQGAVQLRSVSFRYDNDRPALRDLNLDIAAGERIAITGPNGAGKTTLLALILGLYVPDAGEILLDGVSLADLDLTSVRRQAGVVLQHAELFPGTVEDNIRLTAPAARADQVRAAAHTACALEFIESLPDGFSTTLTDGGVGLSGGQRQRLAIARAILAQPALILLDEPTAHLQRDIATKLIHNLSTLPWRPTLLIVTHDPAMAALADRTLALDRGTLSVTEGSRPVPL